MSVMRVSTHPSTLAGKSVVVEPLIVPEGAQEHYIRGVPVHCFEEEDVDADGTGPHGQEGAGDE